MYFHYITLVPGTPGWTSRVFTKKKDPGMICYQFDDGQKRGTPQPSLVKDCSVYANCLQKTWGSQMETWGFGESLPSLGGGFGFGSLEFTW